MANHVRQQIRDAVVSLLTGLTTTGSRVHANRVYLLAAANMPCLVVTTDAEDDLAQTVHSPAVLKRDLTLTITAYAMATSGVDNTLDTILSEVETALGNTVLGGLIKQLTLDNLAVELNGESEKTVGKLAMVFQVIYFTTANAPTVSI